MVPLRPDIAKAENVLGKYVLWLKNLSGVISVKVDDSPMESVKEAIISIQVTNSATVDLLGAMLAREIDGVPLMVWSRMATGALNPKDFPPKKRS